MILNIEQLGKVSVTVEKDFHTSSKEYDKLVIAEEQGTFRTYISRKPVPIGTQLTNREYWIPFSGVVESIVLDYVNFKKKYASGENIEDNAIKSRHIQDASIVTSKLADSSITELKLATNSISTNKIQDRAITSKKIDLGAVETENIKDNNVTSGKLADNSVTRTKIAKNTFTIDHFDDDLKAMLKAATGLPEDLLKQFEGYSENIASLSDAVFPITLTLSVSYSGSQHTASFTVKEKGVDFIADTLVLAKTLGDGTTKTLSNTPAASGSFSSPIESNREVFKIDVTKAGRTSKSASATRYICYAGASADGNISEGMLGGFNRVSATGVGFNPTVTTGSGQYIWLVVPSYLTINKVTSAGFDVTLAAAQNITTALGTFKAYRSANPLSAAVWSLVIS